MCDRAGGPGPVPQSHVVDRNLCADYSQIDVRRECLVHWRGWMRDDRDHLLHSGGSRIVISGASGTVEGFKARNPSRLNLTTPPQSIAGGSETDDN